MCGLAESQQGAETAANALVESYKGSPNPPSKAPRDPSTPSPQSSRGHSADAAGIAPAVPSGSRSPASPIDSNTTASVSNPLLTPQTATTDGASTSATPPHSIAAPQQRGVNGPGRPPLAKGRTEDTTSSPAQEPSPGLQRRNRTNSGGVIHHGGGSTSEIEAADDGDLGAWEERRAKASRGSKQLPGEQRWGEVFTWQVCMRISQST